MEILNWVMSVLLPTAIIIAMAGCSSDAYRYLLPILVNEYFTGLVIWIVRVGVVLGLNKWMVDEHFIFIQILIWIHVLEGVMLLLILLIEPMRKLIKGKKKS